MPFPPLAPAGVARAKQRLGAARLSRQSFKACGSPVSANSTALRASGSASPSRIGRLRIRAVVSGPAAAAAFCKESIAIRIFPHRFEISSRNLSCDHGNFCIAVSARSAAAARSPAERHQPTIRRRPQKV
ncbi:MAG TPA: hypothetical protein VGR91_17735 [Stellaceae bacterium]|nr:hypothetical protein [Stellaceae bacterium]